MDDTITGFAHLDKIADEIGDEAGTCDADYAFQRAAAQMIYDLRNALKQAEARAEKAEKEEGFLTAKLLQTGCLVIPHGSFFLEDVPMILKREIEDANAKNERLTKMVDWLADKHIRCAANGDQWYGPTIGKELHVPMYPSKTEAIDALKEAARRAVADSEVGA